MAGLQRSAISFRRQGSSGLVWDDRFLSGELNQVKQGGDGAIPDKDDIDPPRKSTSSIITPVPPPAIDTLQRSRSTGGALGGGGGGGAWGYRAGKVSPAMEPPSPKVSACGFCGGFGKKSGKGHKKKSKKQPPVAPIKHRSR
ncbi:hypothetical protein MLD38_004925 [Melastoma candidum]|uniref:Uncharacterized protein n=1 Tax=Melastoma candidum TaxID=119954 RepID=A0ACB9SB65_9MYRT|nr:hypothetical protein MLD38_004925 [Melastoma candidum]